MLKNDRFLRALMRQPVDCTPVWLMRQAGRYLLEYNKTRAKAGSFLALCKNPDLACEVTLQPLDRFDLDAAILFSDILTVPDALGLGLYFADGEGPRFHSPVRDEAAISRLAKPDVSSSLRYVFDAVSVIKRELNGRVPLIGFSGAPWTLACYMIEGGGSDDFRHTRTMLYQRPDLMHQLLGVVTETVIDYLNAQIEAGADAVMVFDTWGGLLPHQLFQSFSANYIQRVIGQLTKKAQDDGRTIPSIVFVKGGGQWLEAIADTGCDAVGIDWTTRLADARRRVGNRCALQGNLDPMALFGSPKSIEQSVAACLADFGAAGPGAGHVFNLGHGISQFTNPEHVSVLVEAVHRLSATDSAA